MDPRLSLVRRLSAARRLTARRLAITAAPVVLVVPLLAWQPHVQHGGYRRVAASTVTRPHG